MTEYPGWRVDPAEVVVAIPTLNEERHIEACLDSLFGTDPAMPHVSVAVADGGSKDGTPELLRELSERHSNLHLLQNDRRLQSAAVNLVVDRFLTRGHKYLVRCDAHSVYPPDFIRDVVNSLARNGSASVVTVMDAVGNTCFARAAAWIVDTPLGSGGSAHRGGTRSGYVDHGHHAGFDLDWYRKIGGYDPEFSHNEDAEFDRRLTKAGGRIWLDANIRLNYTMRPSPADLLRQYFNYGQGRARTVLKHQMRPKLRQIAPVLNLLLLAASLPLTVLNPVFWLWPLAYALLLLGASVMGMIRLGSVCGLWAGPALAVMHIGWGAGFLRTWLAGRKR